MINYKYFDLFQHKKGSVEKDWKIEYDGGNFTDWDMFSQSIELEESLCSENELRFGSCEASCLKFKVANIIKPLINEWITASVSIDHHKDEPLIIGRYKVTSENLTADRQYKDIVAYDAMYDIINADVAAWYNSILPDKNSTVTLKQFRESFIRFFGLEEIVPEGGLINDAMIVERTIDPEQISGKDVITAICEINGCFGHIGRDGKFHYIYLPQAIEGLYPADDLFPDHSPDHMVQAKTGHLYPQDPKSTSIGAADYIEVHCENYVTKRITKLQIRKEEDDIGKIWPEEDIKPEDNCYIIEDNFLVYGKSSEQLTIVAQNIFGKITDIVYRPFDADVIGNPCFEVGDPVRFPTRYEIVESYILQRTLKGIQALRDDYSASGPERYAEEVNGVHKSIIQLKGKANILTRTIAETRVEMYDIEKGLYNDISITAGQIRTELQNTADGLSNTITVTAKEIRGELKDTKEGLETSISVTASGIRTEVAQNYETKNDANTEYTSLRGSISLEAGRISSEIERATKSEQTLSGQITSVNSTLSSKIEQTEKDINLSVSQSIQETKTYASNQAAAAQSAANAATDDKLKSYSTTVQMNSAINISATGIKNEVSAIYETKTDAGTEYRALSSRIDQTSSSITAEVTRATNAESALSSRVSITESGIATKVSKGDISSEISQEAGKISLNADRLSWHSTYSSMEEDGTFTTSKANITGGRVEVHGQTATETMIAVRLSDAFATEISASGINGHMKYDSGLMRQWLSIHPTSSYISAPFTIGEEDMHITYALYVGGGRNTHISNVLELDNPVSVGSDRRLKKKIKYIPDKKCLDTILKFKQAEFEYKKNPGIVHHGIIAQDAERELSEGWSPVRNSGEYLGVAYEEIIADLIGAVKYLAKEIA